MTSQSFGKIISVSEIRKNIKQIPKVGGVYKHYIDSEGLKYLDGIQPGIQEKTKDGNTVYLLYIGKATNLFDRLKSHLGFINTSPKQIYDKWLSTLRMSYMANHKDIQSLSEQKKLNQFMDKHIYIQYMPTEDFHTIEKQLISENDLPLNLQDNFHHPFASINRARRYEIHSKFKNENIQLAPSNSPKAPKNNKSRISSIVDTELRKLAIEAETDGITNKSRFLRWFRDEKKMSASQDRLYDAWIHRND